jgi:outer membrane receptor protein involved in Fe transport
MYRNSSLRLALLVLLLFAKLIVFATEPPVLVKEGKVKGIVLDKETNEAIEYATIALYQNPDKKLITGTISDYSGHFKLEDLEFGSYYLVVSFIGYEEIVTEIFNISKENSTINIGNISLRSLAKELEEFEVVGKKAAIEYRIDKKVINVDKQITAEAGTAVDVLENVPSVQVDVEGNVTLRGSSGFTVLVDGRPTLLDPSDVLRQIPSSSIDNIEIITNPSVKYNPDGASGIINVITKKNPFEGISGIVNANIGSFEQYGGDFQLSYRLNKFNFIIAANYNKRTNPGYRTVNRENYSNDSIFYLDSYGNSDRQRKTYNVKGGVEYNLSKNDYFSVSAEYGKMDMSNFSILRYDDYSFPELVNFSYNSFDETSRIGNFTNIDGVYQHNFPKKKKEESPGPDNSEVKRGKGNKPGFAQTNIHYLKLEFSYRNRNIDEYTINELRSLSDLLIGGKKNVEIGPSDGYNVNLDYSLPIKKKDKFEAGLGLRNNKSTDQTELWLYNALTDQIEFVDEFSNFTSYFQNIYSVYALYAGAHNKWGYQVGLRGEYTDRKIDTRDYESYILDRWDYFPSIHLSYDLPKDQQVMASYSRRIDRPRSWYLEPFITWQDAYNARQGNPDLKPEFVDSYDMGYIKKFGNNFLSLEGYYRITHDKVDRISSVYQEIALLSTPENVGKDYSLGLEMMLNLSINDWWDMELSATYFNYQMKGEIVYLQGDEQIVESLDRSSLNWNSRFNNTFKLWKNGLLQLNSRYNSASVNVQGTSSGFYTLDAAFKVTFIERTLSANLLARNILGTARREYSSEGLGFYAYNNYEPKFPVIQLSISYRFNNFKASRRPSSGDDGEDF